MEDIHETEWPRRCSKGWGTVRGLKKSVPDERVERKRDRMENRRFAFNPRGHIREKKSSASLSRVRKRRRAVATPPSIYIASQPETRVALENAKIWYSWDILKPRHPPPPFDPHYFPSPRWRGDRCSGVTCAGVDPRRRLGKNLFRCESPICTIARPTTHCSLYKLSGRRFVPRTHTRATYMYVARVRIYLCMI